MMRAMLVLGVCVSMFWLLSAGFIGGATSLYNVSTENLSSLDLMQNISATTGSVRSTLNSTTTSPNTVQGFDLAGLWASTQLLFKMPEMFGLMVSTVGSVFNLPGMGYVVGGIMLLLTTLMSLKIIAFIRSGQEL